MKKKKLLLLLISLFLIAISCSFILYIISNKYEKEQADFDTLKYEDFVITNHKGAIANYDDSLTIEGYLGGKDYAYYINGKIMSKISYNFVMITFNLYDENDNLLGTAIAGLNDVEQNKYFDFKAVSLCRTEDIYKIKSYKIFNIKAR